MEKEVGYRYEYFAQRSILYLLQRVLNGRLVLILGFFTVLYFCILIGTISFKRNKKIEHSFKFNFSSISLNFLH